MKKAIIISLIVVVFLFTLLLVLPLLFKGALLEKTKATLNKNLQAKIEFTDFNLSLIKRFPKVTIELKNLVITGKNEFQGDTLLSVPVLRSAMQLFSLFRSGEKTIEEIKIDGAKLNLLINKELKTNWDILPASGDVPASRSS